MTFGLTLVVCGLASVPVHACTIFVLTDAKQALFCNNEDWSNATTRVWFVPANGKRYGCAYVGFDDGNAQGGVNTEGLAFDWVMGWDEAWNPDASLPSAEPMEQLLETCASVGEAIAFYRGHAEPDFRHSRILVADRTGASVIIGAKNGKLLVEESKECRGFGYGEHAFNKKLAKSRQPTVTNAACILRACLQKGPYATKYSNIFDLKSGDIFLFPLPRQEGEEQWKGVKYNLVEELREGTHSYDMPQIHLRPLVTNMGPYVRDYHPIRDKEPKVTAHVRGVVRDIIDGTLRIDDFTPEAWPVAYSKRAEVQAAAKALGRLASLTLVDRREEGGKRTYRYEVEFEKNTILLRFVFDKQGQLASIDTEENRWNE